MLDLLRALVAAAAAVVGLALVAPVLVAGAPLWAVAGLARLARPLFERPVLTWRDLFAFDAQLGWRAKPHVDALCFERRDDVFRVVTDAAGWSGRRPLEDADVVVLGDSFAFGYGVDPERSFAHVARGLRVKGVGVPAYGMVQELLVLRQVASVLAGKLVVWLCFEGNDLHDNLSPEVNGYRTPFARRRADGQWEIVTRHLSPAPWSVSEGRRGPKYLASVAAVLTPGPAADRAFAACEFLIAEGRAVCVRAGARLVVMNVPSALTLDAAGLRWLRARSSAPEAIDPRLADRRLGAVCAGLGVPFVALRGHLARRDYKSDDDHWNERGHRRFAALLVSLHETVRVGRAPAAGAPAPEAVRSPA